MPGMLLHSFRKGNRSEYLAQYLLSSLGLAIVVPRQEDIGADFYCSLAKREGPRLTFYAPYIIQIKTAPTTDIHYGGPDKGDRAKYKKEELNWLFGQELPLLIGFINPN